jgi:type IV secretory pathway VirB10-like protein
MLDQSPAAAGHNNPPPFDPAEVERLNAEGAAFLDAAAVWLENGDLKSEDDAQRLNDFIEGVKGREKIAEEARKAAKKPHDDAGKAVQTAFKPVADKMALAKTKVQPLLTAWLQKKEDDRLAEVERQRKAAQFAQEEADRAAAAAAARNDISGEVDAQAAREAAEKQAKEVERAAKQRSNVTSATGGGRTASLRTVIDAEVTNARVLFMRYADRPEVLDVLRSLATREARSKDFNAKTDTIAGAKITISQKAV